MAPVYSKAPKTEALIDSVKSAHFNFNLFKAKISGKYNTDEDSFSLKGNIKIKKDSIIWISISPGLGLELGRILMYPDSIFFINRFEKTYFKNSYADLNKKIESPLTFKIMQSFLTGNAMDSFELKKYYSGIKDGYFFLSSVNQKHYKKIERSKKRANQEIYFTSIIPQNFKINKQQYENLKLKRALEIEYKDFEKYDETLFPESIYLSIRANKEINLSLSYSKIELNNPLKFPFSIPDSYEIIR